MGIKVSVIIPMYNVASLVQRCIHSLCSQTYRHIELIFVNDCSKDDTVSFVETLLASENSEGIEYRIITHEHNMGVAAARNTGLDAAKGKYIYYVDSDDYIEPDTIECLVREAEDGNKDIVSCEWLLEFGTNARHMVQPDFATGEDLFRQMCYGKARWNLWLFLVKRSLYEDNHIRFVPGVNMGEDMMVMLKMSLCAKKVSVIHRSLYHYIQTNSSAISKDIRPSLQQIKANVENVVYFVQERYGDVYSAELMQLKLSLKLPLLISSDTDSYKEWLTMWPESNDEITGNPIASWRTRMLQIFAVNKQFFLLKAYNLLVTKVVYGIIFR